MSQIMENICACWLKSPKRWSLGYEIKLWAPTFIMSNKAFWIITMKCVEYQFAFIPILYVSICKQSLIFWNNTTNQVAFGDQLQDQRWNWDIGKIIANFNFTLDKIPLISNSFKVILFQEKEEFQILWPILLISIHALWMIFIYSSEVHAEKVWRQHIELSFSIK